MNTCVLCMRRRNAFEWTIRSRSRWKSVRIGSRGSGRARPRDAALRAAYGARSCSSHASVVSRGFTARRLSRAGGPGTARARLLVALGTRAALPKRGLRGRQPRRRHPVRRAADVRESDLVAELDAGRISPVLAADPQLDVRPGPAAL